MVELIEPADAESVVIGYLVTALATQDGFADVEVAGALQPDTGGVYVPAGEALVVRGTGGAPRDLIVDTAQITLTSWARTPADEIRASEITRRAVALVRAAERLGRMGSTTCTHVQFYGLPYNDPDPTTGRARYSATCGVQLRGSVIGALA